MSNQQEKIELHRKIAGASALNSRSDTPAFICLFCCPSKLHNRTAFTAVVVNFVLRCNTDRCYIIVFEMFLRFCFTVAQDKSCTVIAICFLVCCKIPILHNCRLSSLCSLIQLLYNTEPDQTRTPDIYRRKS